MLRWGPRYIGVCLLSAATLMFQISYTRVLSVALWHHFVWMVVSIALLGYAASGTILTIFTKLQKQDPDRIFAVFSTLFSASILFTYLVLNQVPFDPARLSWDSLQLLYIIVYYLFLSLPFFLSGITVALAIKHAGNRINRVYFSNLIGSALGSIIVLPFFNLLTGPGVIVLSSIIGGVSSLAFALNLKGKFSRFTLVWTIALLLLLPSSGTYIPIKMSPYKSLMVALRYPDAKLIDTDWNAFSRVDVVESGFVRHAPGLSLSHDEPIPDQMGVIIDGDNLNAITRYDGNSSSLAFTEALPMALPYLLYDNPKVLVFGAGGGLEVLTALHHGSTSITAVEANPIIVRLVREDFQEYTGKIYGDERVRIVISEGRSFLRGSKDLFDTIVLPMAHGAAAASSGIYALSEDYLYTVEAFHELLVHLSENGFLCVSTWLLPPPREDVRIVSLATFALEKMGITDPSEHIAVTRSWGTITVLVGKSPLMEEEITTIRSFCEEMGFDIVHVPGVEVSEVNIFNRFPEPIYYNMVHGILHANEREGFYNGYLYNIKPTTDEKPFFFHFFKWDRLLETYENLDRKWQPLIEGGYLVPLSLVQAFILSIALIIYPIRSHEKPVNDRFRSLTYFFCLGLGYMFVEMAMIQRFILLLGHPTYSISIVIFSLLLSSGIGSYVSGKIKPESNFHKLSLFIIIILTVLHSLASPLISQLLIQPLQIRLIFSFLVVASLGFFMGMPFPLGIAMLKDSKETLIPWAWATNGCASVLGSTLPIIMAMSHGFSTVYLAAGAAYLICLLTFHKFAALNYVRDFTKL